MNRRERRRQMTERIAYRLYQRRLRRGYEGSSEQDWRAAEKIARSPITCSSFRLNQWLKGRWRRSIGWYESTTVEHALETLTEDLKNLAVFDLLALLANVAIIISLGSFLTNGERQRHDQQVYEAWQVITNAHGQPGNGGRRRALEFLNSTPGTPGRRRWFGVPWAKEDLLGVDVSKANLARIQLPGAYLWDANFQEVHLGSANLQKAILGNANFQKAILVNINLQQAYLWDANLQQADLGYANLQQADLGYANFQQADLGYANLQQTALLATNLQQADLGYADLQQTALWRSNLQQADLGYANLQETSLVSANLQQANLESANLQETLLESANFQQADLESANLQEALLLATDLRMSNGLTTQQLTTAKLCHVAFPNSIQGINPNRDCEAMPQALVEFHEQRAQENPGIHLPITLENAKKTVEEVRQKKWDDLE
ncbi:putative low-complexity protein [Leptolyngbya sp. PCC 7375]|nr:putative low-complexity protein [Leptolyngbya sp. PCC 7375]